MQFILCNICWRQLIFLSLRFYGLSVLLTENDPPCLFESHSPCLFESQWLFFFVQSINLCCYLSGIKQKSRGKLYALNSPLPFFDKQQENKRGSLRYFLCQKKNYQIYKCYFHVLSFSCPDSSRSFVNFHVIYMFPSVLLCRFPCYLYVSLSPPLSRDMILFTPRWHIRLRPEISIALYP